VEESDQTEINLFFADTPVEREVELFLLEPSMLGEPFYIPANTVKTFHAEVAVPLDISLIGVTPHCHLLGQSWEVYAESAGDTIPLISIPEWDFNWQGIFTFPSLLHVPTGYTLHAICTYDNTTANPFNPSDPPIPVSWGEFTEDEMFVMFLQFVPYLPGDEDISLSAPNQHHEWAYAQPQLFPPSPNPIRSGELFEIGWMTPSDAPLTLEVFDLYGRAIRTLFEGRGMSAGIHKELRVADWGGGEFLVVLTDSEGHRSHRKFVVVP
jgi:hypothetical protein